MKIGMEKRGKYLKFDMKIYFFVFLYQFNNGNVYTSYDKMLLIDLCEALYDAKNVRPLKTKITGAFLSLLTGLLWMGSNIVYKKMKIDLCDLMFTRAIFQIGIFLIIIKMKRQSVWVYSVDKANNIHVIRFLLVAQGIISGLLLISYLVAISLMNIGDAMAIYFSSFLPTMILSKLFLKERIGLYRILCGMMILTGIILILKPFSIIYPADRKPGSNITNQSSPRSLENEDISNMYQENNEKLRVGEIAAITSMLSLSFLNIMTTLLYKNSSTNSIELSVLYSGFGILSTSFIFTWLSENQLMLFPPKYTNPYNNWQWTGLIVIAIASVLMVFMRFLALKLIGATIENFIFTSQIVFGYEAQVVFFGIVPDNMSIMGSLCITLACLIVPVEEVIISQFPRSFQRFL